MLNQQEKAERFAALHVQGRPLVLFNAWDAGSARAVAAAGASAVATGSWSVAAAHGYPDGEQLPFELAIDNLERIVQAVDLPVTIDLESGYGNHPAAVAESVRHAIRAGAVGCNLEDSVPGTGELRAVQAQAERIGAARAAGGVSFPFFINVRTDLFLLATPGTHDEALVDQTIARAVAWSRAGADGLFVPGLADPNLIARLVAGSPLPVNIMVTDDTPAPAVLAQLGVARVSHGPRPYLAAMKVLEQAARDALDHGAAPANPGKEGDR